MPDHITNELTAPAEVIDFMMDGDNFDFNRVVPMPEIMRGIQPHMGVVDYACVAMGLVTIRDLQRTHQHPADAFRRGDYGAAADALEQSNIIRMLTDGPHPKDFSDKDFSDFVICCQCIKQTGFAYWLDFATKKWGTKWNAYRTKRVAADKVKFLTAWSTPAPIFVALADKFPRAVIRVRWADADFGSNVGTFEIRDGLADVNKLDGTPAGLALASELLWNGELPEGYRRTESGDIEPIESAN